MDSWWTSGGDYDVDIRIGDFDLHIEYSGATVEHRFSNLIKVRRVARSRHMIMVF